ncbi:MAG: 4-hydroxy-tetrahydrodipicolinate synthase [SAR202 cluster bacterium]|jgi:4-hydroxy-tetrahydrodipicolinate synthase|nr:4-hydroxy-tetrahydrodipicolinate synthase [SAR202 cluster bacterium]MDP7104825.1 4-hydroxy-tetrahydrodipicolinate synthase [SAR202 cluster bacterium]HJO82553.1 4-hydroxy-tetrahydrodipicolinate synthase [SAR202 cluster bacterium]|tara:strand:+ start:1816 stop:2715 length:900 start_codon:yes stop_codon:yes gene_type:complete
MVDWHGSFAVIVTPFAENGDIDEAAYRKVIDYVIESGCRGVISAGSTGEFFLMTNDERKEVFSIAVDQANGRVPILAGTSAIRTEDVVDLTRHAGDIGCAGTMLLPPIYIGVDDREVVEFYTRVAEEGGLPIMLYNSPLAVRKFLTPQIVEQLMGLDNVVAIKDSSLDIRQVAALVRFCGEDIKVFVGHEDFIPPGLAVGAVGAVAMLPQVVGKLAVDLYETTARGDMDRSREVHKKMLRVYDLFNVGSGYIAMKESMNMLGQPGGHSRPPMLPFTDSQRAELRSIFEDVGLLTPAGVA